MAPSGPSSKQEHTSKLKAKAQRSATKKMDIDITTAEKPTTTTNQINDLTTESEIDTLAMGIRLLSISENFTQSDIEMTEAVTCEDLDLEMADTNMTYDDFDNCSIAHSEMSDISEEHDVMNLD